MNLCALPRCRTGKYAPSDSLLCEICIEHVVATLRDVEANIAALTPVKPIRPGMVNTSAGFESASPAADHTIVMLDPRSSFNGHRTEWGVGRVDRPEDEGNPLLSVAVLGEWARLAGWTVNTVRDAVSALLVNHRWITDQGWVVEYADELFRLLGQLLRVNGDAPNGPVASCTREFSHRGPDGKRTKEVCGGPVVEIQRAEGEGGSRCLTCGESYSDSNSSGSACWRSWRHGRLADVPRIERARARTNGSLHRRPDGPLVSRHRSAVPGVRGRHRGRRAAERPGRTAHGRLACRVQPLRIVRRLDDHDVDALYAWLRDLVDADVNQCGHAAILDEIRPRMHANSAEGRLAHRTLMLIGAAHQGHAGYRENWAP